MHKLNDRPSGLRSAPLEGIEVRLWDIYLLRNRTNLSHLLSKYSVNGGISHETGNPSGRVSFRFTLYDWERTLEPLLVEQQVPFELCGRFLLDRAKDTRKKKVYIAEDDLDILFALNSMLEDAGYDVFMSHCGERMLATNLPPADLFILDRLMPGVDGIQVCKHLKRHLPTKDIPVIMISASRKAVSEAREAGADDFLEKPFQMKQLLALVAKHTNAALV